MNPKLLASDDLIKERQKIQENDLNARRTDWQLEEQKRKMAEGGTEGIFTCFKCKSKKTTFH